MKNEKPFVAIWRDAVLSASGPEKSTTRYVLLALTKYMNKGGENCYPSTSTLAEAVLLSERAVCEHLAHAAAAGWIVKNDRCLPGRKWRHHLYTPVIPAGSEGTDAGSARYSEGTDAGSVINGEGTDPHDNKALTLTQKGTDAESVNQLIDHSNDHGGAKSGRRPRSRASQIPRTFEPDQTCEAKAKKLGVDLAVELEKFSNHSKAQGRTAKDWQAAFRNWLIKSAEFGRGQAPSGVRASEARVSPTDYALTSYD